jgi:hypothetical protein
MSLPNPEHAVATWSSVFQRKGGPGSHTRLFPDFPPAARRKILARASLAADEIPVLASLHPPGEGFLLTSHRLLCFCGGARRVIENSTITGVAPERWRELQRLRGRGAELPAYAVPARLRLPKAEWSFLEISTREGVVLRLSVEPGPPFLGVWNVLRNIVARNARRQIG